jgi:prephenate dehydrogenase
MAAIAAEIGPHLAAGATVTDVGSVKQAVIAAVQPHIPANVHFIPGHPMAGTEYSGPRSGFATLFDNRWWLLTPAAEVDAKALSRLRDLVQAMGAKVDTMDPAHHDLVLAVVSHTPHLIAYTMVGVADHLAQVSNSEVIQYSATGFRDFTRIAASDPTMWRDVFLTNKDAVLDILGRFAEELFVLQRAIRMGDGDQLCHSAGNHRSGARHVGARLWQGLCQQVDRSLGALASGLGGGAADLRPCAGRGGFGPYPPHAAPLCRYPDPPDAATCHGSCADPSHAKALGIGPCADPCGAG